MMKVSETPECQALGRFETLGSNLRHGIPKEVAAVRVTLGKSQKRFYLQVEIIKNPAVFRSYFSENSRIFLKGYDK